MLEAEFPVTDMLFPDYNRRGIRTCESWSGAFCRPLRILARFCMLAAVAIARCVYVAIEQPRSSVMPKMKFFQVFEKQLKGLLQWNFCNLRGSQLFDTTYVVEYFSCQ